jgi:hypothetical protein
VKRRKIFSATVVALSLLCMGWSPPASADKAATAKKAPAPKPRPKRTPDWNGQFFTEYQGEVGELTLLALGSFLGGTFVSNGEQYPIGGRIYGSRATGSITGPVYQSSLSRRTPRRRASCSPRPSATRTSWRRRSR